MPDTTRPSLDIQIAELKGDIKADFREVYVRLDNTLAEIRSLREDYKAIAERTTILERDNERRRLTERMIVGSVGVFWFAVVTLVGAYVSHAGMFGH